MSSRLPALLVGACVLLYGNSASAQACCASAGGGDFAVVRWCHQYALAAEFSYEHGIGSFDTDGEFQSFNEDTDVNDFSLLLGAGYRFVERFQLNLSMPLRLQHRALSGLDDSWRARQGDAQAALRWMFLGSGAGFGIKGPWGVEMEVSTYVRAPTGVAPEDSDDIVEADVTSDGYWEAGAALTGRYWASNAHMLGLRLSYGHPFTRDVPRRSSTVSVDLGERIGVRGLWSIGVTGGLRMGPYLDARFAGETATDGQNVPDSGTPRLRAGIFATHSLPYTDWDYSAALGMDLPGTGLTRNLPYGNVSASIGVQRNFH